MTNMIPEMMKAMVTVGHGDFDMLVWHEDWPVPTAASGEVLIRVGACGLNNTDINTRTGWYSKAVSEATTGGAYYEVGSDDPSWGGAAVTFPRIQGADICGEIVAVGDGVDPARIGERVITDNWLRDPRTRWTRNARGITAPSMMAASPNMPPFWRRTHWPSTRRCPMPSLQHSPAPIPQQRAC